MKRTLIVLALVFLSFSLSNCKGEGNKDATQMEAVIAVHDELMPKMTDIGLLRQKLMDAIPDSTATEAQKQVILDLKEANTAMMTWMKDFGAEFNFEEITQGKPLTKDKQALLDEYQESVNALKAQMMQALNDGQAVFDGLKE